MEPENLYDGLKKQIERVKEIKKEYEKIPAGRLAAAMMGLSLGRAETAFEQQDVTEMIKAFKDLEEYEM